MADSSLQPRTFHHLFAVHTVNGREVKAYDAFVPVCEDWRTFMWPRWQEWAETIKEHKPACDGRLFAKQNGVFACTCDHAQVKLEDATLEEAS